MFKQKTPKKHSHIKLIIFSAFFLFSGLVLIWISTIKVPSLDSFEGRKVVESTKIYDSTGQILLYDASKDLRRTVVAPEDISPYIKKASVAIEDKDFYQHGGIQPLSILRAILVNLTSLSFKQGGSTITQQVVKNSILTTDKTPTRKLKEWVLALKLEKVLTKDQILNIYLNENPYGGSIYGVEEASMSFFGKHAKDVDLAEAAYLAAIPKAPTFYSPYGNNKDALRDRKNLVLKEMLSLGFISQTEYNKAVSEEVKFKPRENTGGIKAPHFVFFVMDYLAKKYGEDAISSGGYKVITTLNYSIQQKAEEIAKKYGEENQTKFNADNNAFVVIDPKTGNILAMTGSRDYFDKKINGNFNVATAHRQPGSTFKPFVYATAFNKGYTPDTVLFDTRTQFSTNCSPDNLTSENGCYSPENYDSKFRGPMTLRDALAQSINIPSVKLLYLAGIKDSIKTAQDMGIDSIKLNNDLGLTLVLGGGEVSLLDMTSAYSVFANNGMRNSYNSVLKVENSDGVVVEDFLPRPSRVLPEQTAEEINDILSDNIARAPGYGTNSPLYFEGRGVAVKTGTTNDYKDVWIIGYTKDLAVGAWVGNNDNTPMEKKVAGFIIAPMWRAFMDEILPDYINKPFEKPLPEPETLKPVLRGKWQGGISTIISTAPGSVVEKLSGGIHSILYWINKDDPRSSAPVVPEQDPQFKYWEYGVRKWVNENGFSDGDYFVTTKQENKQEDVFSVIIPQEGATYKKTDLLTIRLFFTKPENVSQIEYYIDEKLLNKGNNNQISIVPENFGLLEGKHELRVIVTDNNQNSGEIKRSFIIKN